MSAERDKRVGVLRIIKRMIRERPIQVVDVIIIDTAEEDDHPGGASIGYVPKMVAILVQPSFLAGCRAPRASLSRSLGAACFVVVSL